MNTERGAMKKDNMPQYIAIEGPIGVGKTSLARKIALIVFNIIDENL